MAAPKAFSLGGVGAQPGLDDVVKISDGLQVSLDHAGAERIKKESPAPKAFQAEPPPAAEPGRVSDALTAAQARAAIAVRLLTIMNGKSGVRLQVAEFLRDLLNSGVVPALPSSSGLAAMAALSAACQGSGTTTSSGALADALVAANISIPGISTAEREILSAGSAAAAGVGCLVVVAGKALLSSATAVAAASMEAAGAQAKHLDADLQEILGNKARAAAADELRGLLEGSRAVGLRKGMTPDHQELFTSLPQSLGAAMSALVASYDAVRVEVQSGALPYKAGARTPLSSPHLPSMLTTAARAVLGLAKDSLARAEFLAGTTGAATSAALQRQVQRVRQEVLVPTQEQLQGVGLVLLSDSDAWPGLEAAVLGGTAVAAAHQAVAVEALAAAVALRVAEGPPVAAAATGAADPSEQQSQDGKENKAKDKKKDKKKASGLVLGKGSSIVRVTVEAAAASAGAPGLAALPLAAQGLELEGAKDLVPKALAAVQVLLDPRGSDLEKLLEEVRGVVEANQARRKPKVPKGARDFLPDQMAIREAAFNTITGVFKRHGAVAIDTPVFELRETLTGKYGEDSKLIYDLADQGGEILSLRYDLTVPFARYVAVNAIGNIKRYHIGKVYRRDQPQMTRGRFREFFQCDFDIAGSYATMVADAEVLKVLVEILTDLQLGKFTVKLNHRKLLDAMLAIAGVPAQKFRAICSAIDKLDKEPWEVVRHEMTQDKGLPGPVADKIGEFVVLRGAPRELLAKLMSPGHPLSQHPESLAALQELSALFDFLSAMGALEPISFDLSLARGLDYYTGVIYEAVLEGGHVGSIAAGGRYDKLVGMFSGKDVPAVGVSIGIERVFSIMEGQMRERAAAAGRAIRATETQVLVASIGNGMQVKRMELASQLWAAGIKAEFGFKPNPKMGDQLGYALEQGIPFMALFGEDEIKQGLVKLKDMAAKTEDTVAVAELVTELQNRLAAAGSWPAAAPAPAPAAADGELDS